MFRLVLITLLLRVFPVARSADDLVRTATISSGGVKVTVELKPFSIRSPNFGVLVQDDTGNFLPYDNVPPSRTYFGTVRDHPGAMATALLNVNGTLFCRISFENGVEWSSTGGEASVRGTTGWKSNPQWPTSLVPASKSDAVIFVAEVGVDATYLYYRTTLSGSSVENTVNMAEFSILSANMPFLRDASILHTIGKVVIRASQSQDPYGDTNTGVLLDRVKKQWSGAIASVVGNTHKLGLVVHPRPIGGLAWVATAAKPVGYSANAADANGDFTVIWRHEAGHNWGSRDTEGGHPEGPTIMSGNQLSRFSSSELAKILRYKSGVPRLASNITLPRPPRANMDAITIPQKCTCCNCFKSLDVLANDLDADINSLTIISVQSPSALDSATSISNSSSSGNQITYTPSLAAGLFLDNLKYTIQNSDLKSSTGYVTLRPAALLGWWKMDETSGLTVQDSSGHAANGEVRGGSWDNGNGLSFGGSGTVSLGTKPSITGDTSFSIAVWLWIHATSTSEQVIIQQQRPSGSDGGYQLSLFEGKLQFWVFSDSGDQFRFSASAAIDEGGWHHIVAVRDQAEGRIYINGKLSASASGNIKYLDATIPVFMGADARDNTSFLEGSLMGTKIYNRALEEEEIGYLSTWPEALVAWWKLDDKSGVSAKDSSWNGATGRIEGSTTWNPDGGLTFDGAGKVALGTKPSLSGKTSFSIHVWVKVPPGKSSQAVIIQQRSPASSTTNGFNGEYKLSLVHGKPNFLVYGNSATQFDFSAASAINDGEWHHIAAVRDKGVGRIYIDGELSAYKSGTVVRSLAASIPVFLGWDSRAGNSFFTGSLKGVKIYNQAVAPNFEAERNTMLLASA